MYEGRVGRQPAIVVYVVVLVAVVVAVDVIFFRHLFWQRLAANVGIVAVFAAGYFLVLRRH